MLPNGVVNHVVATATQFVDHPHDGAGGRARRRGRRPRRRKQMQHMSPSRRVTTTARMAAACCDRVVNHGNEKANAQSAAADVESGERPAFYPAAGERLENEGTASAESRTANLRGWSSISTQRTGESRISAAPASASPADGDTCSQRDGERFAWDGRLHPGSVESGRRCGVLGAAAGAAQRPARSAPGAGSEAGGHPEGREAGAPGAAPGRQHRLRCRARGHHVNAIRP